MTIAAHTLGCKLNYAETSHLLQRFAAEGYGVVDFHQRADVYFVNTCTVTAVAEKKCRNAIRQAVTQNPQAIVAVIGCFAQRDARQVARIPGVSMVIGNDTKHLLPQYVRQWREYPADKPWVETGEPCTFEPCYSGDDRTRTFFKIQDGCDYYCTYCAIPYARGRSRSATIEDTVAMARQIADNGTREVVLTGVNTGTFGKSHGERFIDLLRKLDSIEGVLRYRISSIEPNLIDDDIIDFVASSRAFLPHFHIPLQSGSDKVLRLMHRHYDTALYAGRVEHIRRVMPHACIAADIITGFNGEDEETFAQSKAFIASLPISYLHVFPYSSRPNTQALKMGDAVPVPLRKARSRELHDLSNAMRHTFIMQHTNTTRDVLWEHTPHNGDGASMMQGWTDNYIRLQRPYQTAFAGTITPYPISTETIVQDYATDE